jgi:hypothetical protein
MIRAVSISNLEQLNTVIDTKSQRVGFLTEANFHAVEPELSGNVEPVYFQDMDELENAVLDETIVAALISGTPPNNEKIVTFTSEQVNLRAMFVKQNSDTLLNALDYAIVRIIESGSVQKIAELNSPYKPLIAHSCKPSLSHFDWSDLANGTVIRIASLGPYDWGGTDGDYTIDPPLGFWPSYYEKISEQFASYNISLRRIWYPTSSQVFDAITNGEADTTEPYMIVGASHNDFSRKSAFDMTCITSATQDMYFTKRETVKQSDDDFDENLKWALVATCVFCTLGMFVGFYIVHYMRKKEIQGNPVFMPMIDKSEIDNEL